MTVIDIADLGLPCCPLQPAFVRQMDDEGWSVSAGPLLGEHIAYGCRLDTRQRILAIGDASGAACAVRLVVATAEEIADWIEEHRPDWVDDGGFSPYGRFRRVADGGPDAEDADWQLSEDCQAGRIGLMIDVGDA